MDLAGATEQDIQRLWSRDGSGRAPARAHARDLGRQLPERLTASQPNVLRNPLLSNPTLARSVGGARGEEASKQKKHENERNDGSRAVVDLPGASAGVEHHRIGLWSPFKLWPASARVSDGLRRPTTAARFRRRQRPEGPRLPVGCPSRPAAPSRVCFLSSCQRPRSSFSLLAPRPSPKPATCSRPSPGGRSSRTAFSISIAAAVALDRLRGALARPLPRLDVCCLDALRFQRSLAPSRTLHLASDAAKHVPVPSWL